MLMKVLTKIEVQLCVCVYVCTSPCFVSFKSGLSFRIRPAWCFSPVWRWLTSEHRDSYNFCTLLCLHAGTTLYFNTDVIHLWLFEDSPGCGIQILTVIVNSENETWRVMSKINWWNIQQTAWRVKQLYVSNKLWRKFRLSWFFQVWAL